MILLYYQAFFFKQIDEAAKLHISVLPTYQQVTVAANTATWFATNDPAPSFPNYTYFNIISIITTTWALVAQDYGAGGFRIWNRDSKSITANVEIYWLMQN